MNIYLFAHQDDEFFCLPYLREDIRSNKDIKVLYLTDGCINGVSSFVRNQESLKTLSKLGFSKDDVYFVGEELSINDGKLYNHVGSVVSYINQLLYDEKVEKVIFPCFEGGHQDHDAISYIVYYVDLFKISRKLQFPLYNAYNTLKPLFKVFNNIKDQQLSNVNYSFQFSDLKYIFNYKSQIKSFIGLGPFILVRFFFNRDVKMVEFAPSYLKKRPHKNELLYERRTNLVFKDLERLIKHSMEKDI